MRKTYIVSSYNKCGSFSSENEPRIYEMYGESDSEIITVFCSRTLPEFAQWVESKDFEQNSKTYFSITENERIIFKCEL